MRPQLYIITKTTVSGFNTRYKLLRVQASFPFLARKPSEVKVQVGVAAILD